MPTLLPVRPHPASDEAMDSYLERLATANGVTTGFFSRQLVAEAQAPLRFTNIAPPPPVLEVLASWTGIDGSRLRLCLLTRYSIIPAIDSRSRHATRAVVAHGWVLLNRSQACPWCLAETGIWKSTWRLNWVTACLIHECLLVTDCPGCQKPLRSTHHGELRPAGPGALCGNARSRGQGKRCRFDLSRIPPLSAPPPVLQQQRRVEQALRDTAVDLGGVPLPGTTYLKLLQTLTAGSLGQPTPPPPSPLRTTSPDTFDPPCLLGPVRPSPRNVQARAAACVRSDQKILAFHQKSGRLPLD